MALAVVDVRGATGTALDVSAAAYTSTSGSLIVVVVTNFDCTVAGSVTDSFLNSYTQISGVGAIGAGVVGIEVYFNNAGTRGAAHVITGHATASFPDIACIEITGQDLVSPVVTVTKGNATDASSPYNVTAGGAIVGNQIAVYAVTLDTGANTAFTPPGGYLNIYNEPDGANNVMEAAYKINETGTPTVGATSAHAPAAAREAFVTFEEGAGALPSDDPPIGIAGRGAGW